MFLEQLKTKLAAVITLTDELTPDQSVIGDVFLQAATREKPVKHEAGRFVLLNAAGICRITYGGHFYQTGSLDIDISSLNSQSPLVNISLTPKSNYPFPEGTTLLRGKVVKADDNKPVAGAFITVQNRPENTVSEADGSFYIRFEETISVPITINTVKDGFQPAQSSLTLINGKFNRLLIELSVSL